MLSVGGLFGIGDRLFAIPWQSLQLDEDRQCFILDCDKQRLENAPGFDKSNWPDMAEPSWNQTVHKFWTGEDYGIGAAHRYDRGVQAMSEREVDRQTNAAEQAVDSPEGESLRRAEQIGKERSRDGGV